MTVEVAETTTSFFIDYSYFTCYDDGYCWQHDTAWKETSKQVAVESALEAQILSLQQDAAWRQRSWCKSCGQPRSFPLRIRQVVHERTSDGFERTTEAVVPLPVSEKCPCGVQFFPVLGEEACHSLVPSSSKESLCQ